VTSIERLRRARRVVIATLGARAVLWGAALALTSLALLRAGGAPPAIATLVATVVGVALAAALVVRAVPRASLAAVALWVEEHVPQLGYALVTLAERGSRDGAAERTLDARAAAVPWPPVVGRAARRALAPALAAAAAGLALVALLPAAGARLSEAARPAGGGSSAAPTAVAGTRLTPLTAVVAPPAYAGRETRTVREPSSVTGLVGSTVTLRGERGASGVSALVGDRALTVVERDGGWATTLTMPARAAAVRLRDGAAERWVVLAPVPDSAPAVTLTAPARDTVFRQPAGSLAVAAAATDDLGLATGAVEYIVSSGEGESFTFRSGTLGRTAFRGARRGALRATLSLEALELAPGDIVHVRAVARDRNTVSGPSEGVSETRTLRVARAGEYDSIAVEGAPPPEVDKSVLSQRMLILLAEELERKRPRLARERVVGESRRIGADQARLRKSVGEIVFSRLGDEPDGEHSHYEGDGHNHAPGELRTPEDVLRAADRATGRDVGEALDFHGDETPVVAVNRPLLEAYNAMWDASRELDVGQPRRALPHMRVALAAIQRARQAERVYLRGRAPAVIVDVAKVRLQGTGEASAAPRAPRPADDDPRERRARRLNAALNALAASRPSAIDSLLLLRVDALDGAPALAAALGEALDALREGRDATAALARARRLAAGEPNACATLPPWTRAW